jgi:excisionase family DNA binding protein
LISSRIAAARLGVSQATVLRAVARGRLRSAVTTPGGHHRFRPEDVDHLAGYLLRTPDTADLVRSSEAARRLGVSQDTVNRAARDGRLRSASITPGGHRRFATSDLEARLLDVKKQQIGRNDVRG